MQAKSSNRHHKVLAVGHIPTVRYWRPDEAGAVEQFNLQSVLGCGFTVKE